MRVSGFIVGVAYHAGHKGSDDFGDSDDGKANKGIDDGLFGFGEFGGFSGGGCIGDAAVYYKDKCDCASDADGPADGTSDDSIGVDTVGACFAHEVAVESAILTHEGETDGTHD